MKCASISARTSARHLRAYQTACLAPFPPPARLQYHQLHLHPASNCIWKCREKTPLGCSTSLVVAPSPPSTLYSPFRFTAVYFNARLPSVEYCEARTTNTLIHSIAISHTALAASLYSDATKRVAVEYTISSVQLLH